MNNERWIGKGKEYEKGVYLKFEGEYLNGKRWNGIIYNKEDNSQFPIKNGNGKVKEFDYNNRIIFEGEYINGEKNGIVRKYYDNLFLFEGEYLNGKINGKVRKLENGYIF